MKIVVSDWMNDQVHSNRRSISIGSVKLPWFWPLMYGIGGSGAFVLGYPVYSSDTPRFIRWLGRIFSRMSDAKYWVLYRVHPKYRYHMVNSGLGYGYHERDERLLHASMACLVGYIEDCEATGCHDPGDEARAIMQWWTVQRPADQAQHDLWMKELYSGKGRMKMKPVPGTDLSEVVFDQMSDDDSTKQQAMWALERKIHDDEQLFLHKLIDIRPGMWT